MQFQEEPPYNKFDTAPHATNAGYLTFEPSAIVIATKNMKQGK